jgi:hypothetical protein
MMCGRLHSVFNVIHHSDLLFQIMSFLPYYFTGSKNLHLGQSTAVRRETGLGLIRIFLVYVDGY